MLSASTTYSIFLWHHPVDTDFVIKLAGELQERGMEVHFNEVEEKTGEKTFNPVDWRLSTSDCVVFLLSQTSVKTPSLRADIEKVLRRGDRIAVSALLDEEAIRDIPLLFRFIKPLDFYEDYEKAVSDLVLEVHEKQEGAPSTLQRTRNPWIKLTRWIFRHFRRYMLLQPLTFSWQITVENLIVSLTVTGIIQLLFQPPGRTNLANLTAGSFIWGIIILGPIIETLLLQTLPVNIGQLIGLRFAGQILISIIPFAWLHFSRSIGAGIGAGIIGGFYSAFTYVFWKTKSQQTAFWVTAFSHCLYNLAIFAMIIGEY
jgi:hypothetical protein